MHATGWVPSGVEDATVNVAIAFTEIAQTLMRTNSVDDSLHRAVEISALTVESCEGASVLLALDGKITDAASSDSVATQVSTCQLQSNEGPGIDAIEHRVPFYSGELGEDPRWPTFGPRASSIGMRSVLSLPFSFNKTLGSLDLYARFPYAFGAVDRARGLLFASMAGLALGVRQDHEDEERRAENLQAALVTRELVGQAQGILIEREGITADQAFDVLRRASQHLNVKLREVARDLVETGERPNTGPPPPHRE